MFGFETKRFKNAVRRFIARFHMSDQFFHCVPPLFGERFRLFQNPFPVTATSCFFRHRIADRASFVIHLKAQLSNCFSAAEEHVKCGMSIIHHSFKPRAMRLQRNRFGLKRIRTNIRVVCPRVKDLHVLFSRQSPPCRFGVLLCCIYGFCDAPI